MENITKHSKLDNLQQKLQSFIEAGVHFVVFHKPCEKHIHTWLIKPDGIETVDGSLPDSGEGFLLHPYKKTTDAPVLIMNPSISFSQMNIPTDIDLKDFVSEKATAPPPLHNIPDEHESRKHHRRGVEAIIDEINNTELEKAVLSRQKFVPGHSINQAPEMLCRLIETYPQSFVYLLHLPGYGLWMGATPETLLEKNGKHYRTMALAGTTKAKDPSQANWTEKEYHEQEVVSNFIEERLRYSSIKKPDTFGPRTIGAGNVFHLRTDIEFDHSKELSAYWEMIQQLHPTPAVCGLPVEKAKETISQNETHKREYYTGFLGPFSQNKQSTMYVNLRCLQFVQEGIVLYVGGGITAGSDPEAEWTETENKAQTLLSVIEKISTFA